MNSSLKKNAGASRIDTAPRTPDELEYQERERFDMEYGTNTHVPLAVTGFLPIIVGPQAWWLALWVNLSHKH